MANNIKFKMTFEDDGAVVEFDLRRVRMFEQEELYTRLGEAASLQTDAKTRADAQYKALVDALVAWSANAKDVKAAFDGRDAERGERVANDAINHLFRSLTPKIVF